MSKGRYIFTKEKKMSLRPGSIIYISGIVFACGVMGREIESRMERGGIFFNHRHMDTICIYESVWPFFFNRRECHESLSARTPLLF
jgi:hypothetical protein